MDDDSKDLFAGAQEAVFSRPGPWRCPKCPSCDFQYLPLYIDRLKTFSDAMEKRNRFNTDYSCDQCGATGEIAGKVQIASYPRILLAHFARLSPGKSRAGCRKNRQAVGYEETIDLGRGADACQYKLMAVAQYSETTGDGHNATDTRDDVGANRLFCNDCAVADSGEASALGSQAYLLFTGSSPEPRTRFPPARRNRIYRTGRIPGPRRRRIRR